MSEETDQTPLLNKDSLTNGELITLTEASKLSGYNSSFLGRLAARGRLKAKRSGGVWLTTIAAIEEYKNTRSSKNIPKKYRNRT